jgi:hypothetical protein
MRVTLDRETYDGIVAKHLLGFTDDPEIGRRMFRNQYPKPAALVRTELAFRGGDIPVVVDGDYTAGEVDAVLAALESLGSLTREAEAARTAGMSLAEWRRRFSPEPVSSLDDYGGTPCLRIEIPCDVQWEGGGGNG